jgi:hypothetical protein
MQLLQHSDMQEEMRLEAIDVIVSAMEKYCMVEQAVGPSRQYDVGESDFNLCWVDVCNILN